MVRLLNNFTVTSPLRLLLPPPCVESIFTRPERRISMFDRSDLSLGVSQTPRRQTPTRTANCINTPRSAKIRSTRRHLIDGVWPSILETSKSRGIGEQCPHLKATVSTSEMSAHSAIKCDLPPNETETLKEVDLEAYPFVKRWKKELDLTFQQT